jgi:hypothetical protein
VASLILKPFNKIILLHSGIGLKALADEKSISVGQLSMALPIIHLKNNCMGFQKRGGQIIRIFLWRGILILVR